MPEAPHMREMVHVTAQTVRAIQEEVLKAHGGLAGLRDEGLLDSAVSAPQATWRGESLFKDPVEVAAAYLFYICRNRPFNDGNKRAALASCLVVLKANGIITSAKLGIENKPAWEALTLDVASGQIDRDETAARLRELVT